MSGDHHQQLSPHHHREILLEGQRLISEAAAILAATSPSVAVVADFQLVPMTPGIVSANGSENASDPRHSHIACEKMTVQNGHDETATFRPLTDL